MKPSDDVIKKGLNGNIKNDKKDKAIVLYLHVEGTDYECKDCMLFIKNQRCMVHGKDDVILETDSCGLFIYGESYDKGAPMGLYTPERSGLTHSKNGFSCKRCEYFNPPEKKCSEVDENSDGDDPGIIHPNACCNNWDSLANAATSTDGL